MPESNQQRLIWDWPTRLWHWLFAIAVVGAWITGQWGGFDWRQWHFWFGQSVVGLLIFRLVWGIVGPRHARFHHFITGPRRLWAYLRTLPERTAPESAGHSPLAALSVIAFLAVLTLQSVSGLFISDDILYEGPWFPAVSADTADWFSSIHHQLGWPIIVLIGLHILAILAYRYYKGYRLTSAMITGKKPNSRVPASASIPGSRSLLAVVVIVLVIVLTWWLLVVAPPEPAADLDFW